MTRHDEWPQRPETGQPPVDWLSPLAHDMFSALSDILGGLGQIDPALLEAANRAQLARIRAAAQTLARLLNTLGAGGDNYGVHSGFGGNPPIRLDDFLGDIEKRWGGRAREHGQNFVIEAADGLPGVIGLDRVALERIVGNLLANALKYSSDGRVLLLVECDSSQTLTFRVADEGPGIPETALSHVFRYRDRAGNRDGDGRGLGLFIAHELAEFLGGRLEISNREGGGACLRLSFRHKVWSPPAPGDGDGRDEPASRASALTGLRVLLAEDNGTNQLVATQMLDLLGAQTVVAADGVEALEHIRQEHFDLALLDIEMPRLSGLDVIRAIREMPAPVGKMPVIALTAYAMHEHRERIVAAGADGVIAKPVISVGDFGRMISRFRDAALQRVAQSGPQEEAPHDSPAGVVEGGVFQALVRMIGAESAAELLEKLKSDTRSVRSGIERARVARDMAEIRSQTHILISVSGAIGARRLLSVARRLNAAANGNARSEVDALCADCLRGLAELDAFIMQQQSLAGREAGPPAPTRGNRLP